MNYSTAIFLISDDVRAIMATYEAGDGAPRTMFKTLDQRIKVNDLVVVESGTRHKVTVCKVIEVDVEVDFDCPTKVEWVKGLVDTADADEIKRQEEDAINKIKSAEKRSKREELRAKLMADVGEDSIKSLPIYTADEKAE